MTHPDDEHRALEADARAVLTAADLADPALAAWLGLTGDDDAPAPRVADDDDLPA